MPTHNEEITDVPFPARTPGDQTNVYAGVPPVTVAAAVELQSP